MHEFRWNGGGDHKGKPWADHLPTDAAVSWYCSVAHISLSSDVCKVWGVKWSTVDSKYTAVVRSSSRSISTCRSGCSGGLY